MYAALRIARGARRAGLRSWRWRKRGCAVTGQTNGLLLLTTPDTAVTVSASKRSLFCSNFQPSSFKDDPDRKHLFDKLKKMKAEKEEEAKRQADGKSVGMALAEGAGPAPSKNEMEKYSLEMTGADLACPFVIFDHFALQGRGQGVGETLALRPCEL